MIIRSLRIVAVLTSAALVSLAIPNAVSASGPPLAAPPADAQVTLTINAMLQASDVPASLGGDTGNNVSYIIPPGGQDPLPLCPIPGGESVLPSSVDAIGFASRSGRIIQDLYVYPSAAQAQANWVKLRAQIDRRCARADRVGEYQWTSTRGTLDNGAQEGRWVRFDSTQTENPAYFSVVGPSDNAIVITRFRGKNGLRTTTGEQRAGVHALFDTLEQRYAERDTLPLTQPALIKQSTTGLLRPEDLPASLPIEPPSEGGWSNWSAQVPAQDPFNRCNPRNKLLPVDTGSFSVSFGSADPLALIGSLQQQVFTYNSPLGAQAAWNRLTVTIKDCNESFGTLYSDGGNRRSVAGTITLNDLPGLTVRSVESEDFGRDSRYVSNSYGVYLLNGDSIVFVNYARSQKGLKPFSLDQDAINALTVFATQKWDQAASTQ
jgi:hypothetical protein